MPGSTGTSPHPDRTPRPLPSEAEADRLYEEVARARSTAPPGPRRWLGAAAQAVLHPTSLRVKQTLLLAGFAATFVVTTVVAVAVTGDDEAAPGPAGPPVVAVTDGACLGGSPTVTPELGTSVPCTGETARLRVRGRVPLLAADDTYPGPDVLRARGEALCRVTYADLGADRPLVAVVPDETGWYLGARTVVCAVPMTAP